MRRDYLSRLSRAARWYLPPAEAAEVLEDYREIVAGRSEEELRREVGSPQETVRRLAQPKAYRRWLAVFGVLAVCVLFPALGPIWSRLFWWNGVYWFAQLDWAFLLTGGILSFAWFQRNGKREGALPRGILLAALVPLVGMAWAWFCALAVFCWLEPFLRFMEAAAITGPALHWSLLLSGLAMGLTGLLGLVKARLRDRRWRAVYILGLAGALLSLGVWSVFSSMNLDMSASGWWTPLLMRYGFITIVGLLGTGVALC